MSADAAAKGDGAMVAKRHAKKLMYGALLLIFAAALALKPNLSDFHSIHGVKGSVDKDIREGNFIASRLMSVRRGDIVIFKMDGQTWIYRLIGLPGDVISIADGGILIDGKPIDTTFLEKATRIVPSKTFTVPPNQIVVGTGATSSLPNRSDIEPGTFLLMQLDRRQIESVPEMRRGEVVFSVGEMNRSFILAVLCKWWRVTSSANCAIAIRGSGSLRGKLLPMEASNG